MSDSEFVVICFGNPEFGDDRLGYEVSQILESKFNTVHLLSPSLDVVFYLEKVSKVAFVDAFKIGGKPGTVYEVDISEIPETYKISTHSKNLKEIVEIASYSFGKNYTAKLFGIEGENFVPSRTLSKAVKVSIPALIERINIFYNSP